MQSRIQLVQQVGSRAVPAAIAILAVVALAGAKPTASHAVRRGESHSPCAYNTLVITPVSVPSTVSPNSAFSVTVAITDADANAAVACVASYGPVSGSGSITVDFQYTQNFGLAAGDGEDATYTYTVYFHSGAAGGCNTLWIRAHDSANYYPVVCVS